MMTTEISDIMTNVSFFQVLELPSSTYFNNDSSHLLNAGCGAKFHKTLNLHICSHLIHPTIPKAVLICTFVQMRKMRSTEV